MPSTGETISLTALPSGLDQAERRIPLCQSRSHCHDSRWTSHTLLISELIVVPDFPGEDVRGRLHNGCHTGNFFRHALFPEFDDPGSRELLAKHASEAPATRSTSNVMISARSYHKGGVLTRDG